MKKRVPLFLWGWASLWLAQACVEPFDTGIAYDADLLTVNATLTDAFSGQTVRLSRSISDERSSTIQPVAGAQVEVLVNGTQPWTFRESVPGTGFYQSPAGFPITPGATYQLRFRLPGGQQYESSEETMPRPKAITRVYDQFDAQATELPSRSAGSPPIFQPGHRIYVDTPDPVGTGDFYQWSWKVWEAQPVCATCEQGSQYNFGQGCVRNRNLPASNVFDYYCEQRCWEIRTNRELNLMADALVDGKPIVGRLAGTIPYYSRGGALVEIEQRALTPGAFRYLKLLADQSQNTGSLADTPPAAPFGNVVNVATKGDRAVGYFTVASVSSVRYWLDRKNAPLSATPLGLLGGREVQPEPPDPVTRRPPLAPCTPTLTRTPDQPEGWRN